MIRIGLTGGMGTGKATVARIFRRLGAFVIDADSLAREVIRPGRPVWREIVAAFGGGILKADGSVNRRGLAAIVFSDESRLRMLNSIVHPPVIRAMERKLARMRSEGKYPAAVVNAPLLFEAGLEGAFDAIVVVTCPREEQIRRCVERDGFSEEEIESRLRMQIPLAEKVRRADYVIDNGGSREKTEEQVRQVWRRVLAGSVR